MYACLGLGRRQHASGYAASMPAAAMVPTAHCSSGRDARPLHSPNPNHHPLSTHWKQSRGVHMLMVRHAVPVEVAGGCFQLRGRPPAAAPQLQVCPSAAGLAYLGHALPVGLGVEGRLGQQHWVLLWSTAACKLLKAVELCVVGAGSSSQQARHTAQQPTHHMGELVCWPCSHLWCHAQLVVEGVVPDLLHVLPVGHNAVLNGVAQREDTTLALCLITHIGVLQQAVLSAGGLFRPQWRGISPEASCKVLPLLISPFGPCPPSR